MEKVYVVIDIETSGSIPGIDEIIEIGAVKLKGQEIIDTFQSLVKPIKSIPQYIQKLTGITNELVADAPHKEEVIPLLQKFFTDTDVFVAHNAEFDFSFLEYFMQIQSRTIYDTVEIGRVLLPFAPNYRLKTLTEYCGIPLNNHHRGLDDAMATTHLFLKYLEVITNLHPTVREDILSLTQDQNWLYKDIIEEIAKQKRYSFEKLSANLPYTYQEALVKINNGFIKDNTQNEIDINDINDINKEVIKEDEILELFSTQGPLAQNYLDYEFRNQQIELSQGVAKTFARHHIMVAEAGTGTGKSLGYLVPAALWAHRTCQRIVVSTHTINLQEQLINKDIPTIINTFQIPIKSVIVKGKNNYICLRKWHNNISNRSNWNKIQLEFYLKILVWLSQTYTGDKSELNLDYRYNELWASIACSSETCLTANCNWYYRGCFIQKARKQAENAHILIVNHSLVLADIKTDNKILPNYQYLVIDEAHHIENEATEHLGINVDEISFGLLINSIYNNRNEKVSPGFLGGLKLRQGKYEDIFVKEDFINFLKQLDNMIQIVKEIREGINGLFNALGNLVAQEGILDDEEQWNKLVRLTPQIKGTNSWGYIVTANENLLFRLYDLVKKGKQLTVLFEEYDQKCEGTFADELKDINNILSQLNQIISDLKFLISNQDNNYVFWVENLNNYEGRYYNIKGAPIRVDEILAEKLFVEKSVVLTSATLTVEDKFDYFLERIGINLITKERVNTMKLSSPFNYEQNVLLCIPNDIKMPIDKDESDYLENVCAFIKNVAIINKGRTMVLFTSHKSLKETYFRLKEPLTREGIMLLGHNLDGNRSIIIEEFKKNPQAVLFGTSSFWEGVDIPGDRLTCVIIVKIPFQVPTIPLVAARVEELENNKKDGFRNFSLPNAVIRLKQGFGRLIRSQKDQGIVVILDNRLLNKYYGRTILNSLPIKSHIRGESNLILQKIKDWQCGERPNYETLKILNSVEMVEKYLRKLNKR